MEQMQLGAFSVGLAVKNVEASREFYEKLGFAAFAGDASKGWLILRNGDTVIGLFQGMFEKNVLTFNPGGTNSAQPVEAFTDVRELQRRLKASGSSRSRREANEATSGPAHFMVVDPTEILFWSTSIATGPWPLHQTVGGIHAARSAHGTCIHDTVAPSVVPAG